MGIEVKKCPQCGHVNRSGANFCGNCATELASRGKSSWLTIGLVAGILVAISLLVLMVTVNKSSDNPSGQIATSKSVKSSVSSSAEVESKASSSSSSSVAKQPAPQLSPEMAAAELVYYAENDSVDGWSSYLSDKEPKYGMVVVKRPLDAKFDHGDGSYYFVRPLGTRSGNEVNDAGSFGMVFTEDADNYYLYKALNNQPDFQVSLVKTISKTDLERYINDHQAQGDVGMIVQHTKVE